MAAPLSGVAESSNNIESQLKLADQLRTTSPQKFVELLFALENKQSEFTTGQREFFRYLKAYNQSIKGNFQQALETYNDIFKKDLDQEVSFRALASIVNTYAIDRDYHNGTKYLLELLNRSEEIKNERLRDLGNVVASVFYNQMGRYELGKQFATSVLNNGTTDRYECIVRHLIIESDHNLRTLSDNLNFLNSSLDFCRSIGDVITSGLISVYQARELAQRGLIEESLSSLNSSNKAVISTNYPPLQSDYFSTLGDVYFKLGDFENSKKYALTALDAASKVGNLLPVVVSSTNLYEIAEAEGNLSEALKYYKVFADAEKKYIDEMSTRELILQRAEADNVEKTNQLTLLDKENTLLKTQAELSRKEAQNNQLLLALACSAVLILFAWIYRNRRVQIRLRKMAQTDALTGINNRNHFTSCAEQQLRHTKHSKIPISFILFDLDLFKKINDTYGHQTGDWALKNAVRAASSVCRSNDIIGRMGGEEFALLLPNCSADKAVKIAEMCRKAIENIDTSETGFDFNITASFGVSDSSICQYEFDKLYGCADAALYQSKTHGRNQVYQFAEHTPAVFG